LIALPMRYGFRPGRSARQAVAQAQRYIARGYSVVVDLDLDKFFDRVNHDSLMARVAARVTDKRVLKLIRAFLNPPPASPRTLGPSRGLRKRPLSNQRSSDDATSESAR
jgi:RNA-directed DNA polymerase